MFLLIEKALARQRRQTHFEKSLDEYVVMQCY